MFWETIGISLVNPRWHWMFYLQIQQLTLVHQKNLQLRTLPLGGDSAFACMLQMTRLWFKNPALDKGANTL